MHSLANQTQHYQVIKGEGKRESDNKFHTGSITSIVTADELLKIRTLVEIANTSFCGKKPTRMHHSQYSLRWHDLLPHVAKGLSATKYGEIETKSIYMFGVAAGADSMPMVHGMFPQKRIFGFDSFGGLPAETHEESRVKQWRKGMFGPNDMLGRTQVAQISKLISIGGGTEIVTIVPGFFNESLSVPNLVAKHGMGPAFYVDIDCDLYVSTMPALDFIFREKLARKGTLISMDDFWIIPCTKFWLEHKFVSPLDVGEGGAFHEIAKRYGVVFACVAGSCRIPPMGLHLCDIHNHIAPIFMVTAILGPGGNWSSGLAMSIPEQTAWMRTVAMCRNQAGK